MRRQPGNGTGGEERGPSHLTPRCSPRGVQAVFAFTTLGLHANKCWLGQSGVGHGMSVAWVHSPEYGSGKTHACLLGKATVACWDRPLIAGDATKSLLNEVASVQSNITNFVDDIVKPDGISTHHAQMIRSFYDKVGRCVSGKLRVPSSPFCFTANQTINDDDRAFQSRLITIPFKELKCDPGKEEDPAAFDNFLLSQEFMSALLPDLALVGLWNGELDKEAIQDWAQFLQKALGTRRDRNANEWAKLGYIWCNLNVLFQSTVDETEKMFEWMLVTVTKACHELTNHAGVFDRFILAILQVKEVMGVNLLGPAPEKVLHHHNIRTTCEPPGFHSGSFWAIRVGPVCHVLKALTGKTFKENEIYHAIEESDDAISGSRGKFYDITKNPWPIKKDLIPEGENQMMPNSAPLEESELLADTLTEYRCIYIKTDYIDKIRKSLEKSGRLGVDYKSIVIQSAKIDEGSYNFVEALTVKGWYGYRTLSQGTFRTMCGATNEMQCGGPATEYMVDPEIEADVKECNFGSVAQCFSPRKLLEFFTYDFPTELDAFPSCFTKLPFAFRNDDGDEQPDQPVSEPGSPERVDSPAHGDDPLSPPRRGGSTPNSRSHRTDAGLISPAKKPSPLAPRTNTPRSPDDEPIKRRRARASPTNLALYPRPPAVVNSDQTRRQWTDYALAMHRLGRTGGGTSRHRNAFILGEAEDDGEGADEARFSESNTTTMCYLTLS